jgi:hypothetical protein
MFGLAEGLWEEIDADLFVESPLDAVQLASDENQTRCQPVRTVNQRKRKQLAASAYCGLDDE